MIPTRVLVWVVLAALAGSVRAGPPYHALELAPEGTVFFVDLPRSRLLRFNQNGLVVISDLEGVPEGDHLQNLVWTHSEELYLGDKKSVWRIGEDSTVEVAIPPSELKSLFARRPADLAPDGSVYVARDFRNIERSLPGGDAYPIPVNDRIGRIRSMTVTPYGQVYCDNGSGIAKVDSDGTVSFLLESQDGTVLGLAAEDEVSVLMLRQDSAGSVDLVRIDLQGESEVVLSADQIVAARALGSERVVGQQ